MCWTVLATSSVKVILSLLVCLVVDGETQDLLRIQAIFVTERGKSSWNQVLPDLTKLILASDISLLMWKRRQDESHLNSILDSVNPENDRSNPYTMVRSENFPAQYAFVYRESLFGQPKLHAVRPESENVRIFFPFVVNFHMKLLGMKPLTLAALTMVNSAYQQTGHVLAKTVANISADGNPFALIGRFPVSVQQMVADALKRFNGTQINIPAHSAVDTALLLNGLENSKFGNLDLKSKGITTFSIRPLFINITFNQLNRKLQGHDGSGGEPARGIGGGEGLVRGIGSGGGPVRRIGGGGGPVRQIGGGGGPVSGIGGGVGSVHGIGEGGRPVRRIGGGGGPVSGIGGGVGSLHGIGEGGGPVRGIGNEIGPVRGIGGGGRPVSRIGGGGGPVRGIGGGLGRISGIGGGGGSVHGIGEGGRPVRGIGGGGRPVSRIGGGGGSVRGIRGGSVRAIGGGGNLKGEHGYEGGNEFEGGGEFGGGLGGRRRGAPGKRLGVGREYDARREFEHDRGHPYRYSASPPLSSSRLPSSYPSAGHNEDHSSSVDEDPTAVPINNQPEDLSDLFMLAEAAAAQKKFRTQN